MARKKVENIVIIPDLHSAKKALAEIRAFERELEKNKIANQEEIDRIKAASLATAKIIEEKIKPIAAGLRAFAEHNRDELFKKRKSVQTPFGAFGFRKTPPSIKPLPKHTFKMILGKLKELKLTKGIRTKEEVNKEELLTWPDEKLELVGAKRHSVEEFYYETETDKEDTEAA